MDEVSPKYNRAEHIEKCRSKRWFESKAEADLFAEQTAKHLKIPFWSYRCSICGLWKITQNKNCKSGWFDQQEMRYRRSIKKEHK